jgi:hypothetical protein
MAVGERTCLFCAGDAVELYLVTSSAPEEFGAGGGKYTRNWSLVPLCVRHHTVLGEVASRGRIHKSTGVRWWLGIP